MKNQLIFIMLVLRNGMICNYMIWFSFYLIHYLQIVISFDYIHNIIETTILKQLNENKIFHIFNHILENSTSITMICTIMDVILLLIQYSLFLLMIIIIRSLFHCIRKFKDSFLFSFTYSSTRYWFSFD